MRILPNTAGPILFAGWDFRNELRRHSLLVYKCLHGIAPYYRYVVRCLQLWPKSGSPTLPTFFSIFLSSPTM